MKTLTIAVLAAVTGLLSARAEIAVYDLSFDSTGKTVNYSFLEGGYLVVDEATGGVTSIVVLTDPTTRLSYYTTGLLDGTYITMIEEGTNAEYGAIYAMSNSGADADNIAFQIFGKTSKFTNVGGGTQLNIPRKFSGYMLASSAESSSVNATTQIVTYTYGFAGASKVASRLQDDLTTKANNSRISAASELEILGEILVQRGINPEASPTATATATATASATTSP